MYDAGRVKVSDKETSDEHSPTRDTQTGLVYGEVLLAEPFVFCALTSKYHGDFISRNSTGEF